VTAGDSGVQTAGSFVYEPFGTPVTGGANVTALSAEYTWLGPVSESDRDRDFEHHPDGGTPLPPRFGPVPLSRPRRRGHTQRLRLPHRPHQQLRPRRQGRSPYPCLGFLGFSNCSSGNSHVTRAAKSRVGRAYLRFDRRHRNCGGSYLCTLSYYGPVTANASFGPATGSLGYSNSGGRRQLGYGITWSARPRDIIRSSPGASVLWTPSSAAPTSGFGPSGGACYYACGGVWNDTMTNGWAPSIGVGTPQAWWGASGMQWHDVGPSE
jgi:hypothetical protein